MFRSFCRRGKLQGTVHAVMLRTRMDQEHFDKEVASILFSQPVTLPSPNIYAPLEVNESQPIETLFTIAELTAALEQINVHSAPGKDGVTWAMLQDLPTTLREELLEKINEIWIRG